MTSALALLAYALAAGVLGPRMLGSARWPRRAPRLAIVSWQALALSVLLSLTAAALALAISLPHVGANMVKLVSLCTESLQHSYSSPQGVAAALLGLAGCAAVAGRVVWCAAHAWVAVRRESAAHVAAFDLVGRSDILPGALVVEHTVPFAFCIGGRHRRIVVTQGLLSALRPDEIGAVLTHERVHLEQHHHRTLMRCQGLFSALTPLFPQFHNAMTTVQLYVELCADDGARKHVSPLLLRGALARLACMSAPKGSLAASSAGVIERLERLSVQPRRLTPTVIATTAVVTIAAVAVPLLLSAVPAVAIAWEGICHFA